MHVLTSHINVKLCSYSSYVHFVLSWMVWRDDGGMTDHSLSGTELIQKLILVLTAVTDVRVVLNIINNVHHFLGVVEIFRCIEEASITILHAEERERERMTRNEGRKKGYKIAR